MKIAIARKRILAGEALTGQSMCSVPGKLTDLLANH